MDKTKLVSSVATLFRISGHSVDTSVRINHREIDVVARELQGLVRKTILVECAEFATPVGVGKMQEDINKLTAAREKLMDSAVVMHVSRSGYTPDASGYARERGIEYLEYSDLVQRLVNFDEYVAAVESDRLRTTILKEYQPTKLHSDGHPGTSKPALEYLDDWMTQESQWLTVLGDYGVGKSWMLKRYLYHAIEKYKNDSRSNPLPFFVPLQRYTKAFDYENLILKTFQTFGLVGVSFEAFQHLVKNGRVLFLFDSFDEMAQHLTRDTIRENLRELLVGIAGNSRAIMTSRPTYFEGRAERLLAVEADGTLAWHPLDLAAKDRKTGLSRLLERRLDKGIYGRLSDLSDDQRKRLFGIVLGNTSKAYKSLIGLLNRFSDLGGLSQRAVFARLLTTVAETLASNKEIKTIEGYPLVPSDLKVLNQAKVFEIVVYNLLHRDQGIGQLSASQRLQYLRTLAIHLQRVGADPFASKGELREIVKALFSAELRRTDAPEQLLENLYRTCRRHSGLTTEGQFRDTTGQVDVPVDEDDQESRVGFSHNSLREYLVADALAEFVRTGRESSGIRTLIVSDATADLFADMTTYDDSLIDKLRDRYSNTNDSSVATRLFDLVFGLLRRDAKKHLKVLGVPPRFIGIDLSGIDISGLPLTQAAFNHAILPDTDLRSCDLRDASFDGAVLDGTMLDGAVLDRSDFRGAEIDSILVFDSFDTGTTARLTGKSARQWLFSNGAKVSDSSNLNPYLGRPWYQAAREVTKTLQKRMAGTHQEAGLAKGTKLEHRELAKQFVRYLVSNGVLERVTRSKTGSGWVVKVSSEFRSEINRFSDDGEISDVLKEFFDDHMLNEDRKQSD